MRYLFSILAGLFITVVSPSAFGQVSNPLPSPTPKDQLPSFQKILDDARKDPVGPGEGGRRRSRRDSLEAARLAKLAMEPEKAVAEKHARLLKMLDARLVRLHPDFKCESKFTLSVEEDCAGRVIGASRYEGLHYNEGGLYGDSFFTIFMFADAGEVDFQSVDLTNEKVKTFIEIAAPTTFDGAHSLHRKLAGNGIAFGDLRVANRTSVTEGKTFIVRMIAYKAAYTPAGGYWLPSRRPSPPLEFLTVNRSGRRDSIFAAKVVKRSDDGIIHLLWRPISRKKPPSIRFEKDEIPRDFRIER
jgi:hypothetical protein